jgi:cytochrome c-type biogenesis protein CcmH/NrfG
MEPVIYIILGLILLICAGLCYMCFGFYQLVKAFTTPYIADELPATPTSDEHYPPDVEEQLTEYEQYVIQRETEMDARIAKMKEELANQQEAVERKGVPAVELHPDVKNIPHGDVRVMHDLLPTEVAE